MKTTILTLILVGCIYSVFAEVEVYEEPEIHSSIRMRNINLFNQLLPVEENLSIRNSRGQSPLTLAMILSETDMMRSLLDNGAQLDLNNPVDQHALKYASRPVRQILKQYHQVKLFCHWAFKKIIS